MDENEFMQWWVLTQPLIRKKLIKYKSLVRSIADLEQDLAFIAWTKRSSFQDPEFFRSWIVQKAEWLALDELRSDKRARKIFSQLEEGMEGKIGPTQEQRVVLRELIDAINQLPSQQRLVVRGTFEGKAERELAGELRVSEATVRSLRRFGRAKLFSILRRKEE